MHDDHWADDPRDDDPWAGRVPWMRRTWVRRTLVAVAAGSFLILTLMSTCAPRRTVPAETTTTTGLRV